MFIHNNYTFESIAKYDLHILFIPSAFSIWLQLFISDGIARCAVPIFFVFSSYLQFKKNDSYKVLLKKRTRSLLLPYLLWTIIALVFLGATKLAMQKLMPSILENPDRLFAFETPLEWFWAFVGDYSKYPDVELPFLIQFWYVRDLFILMLFSPLFKKIIKRFPIEFFLLSAFFYFSGIRPVIVSAQALFFYMIGYFWVEEKIDLFAIADRCRWMALLILFALFVILRWRFYTGVSSLASAIVIFSSLILLKFSDLICKNEKVYAVSKYLASYSFFLFAVHYCPLLSWIRTIWTKVLPMKNGFFCLLEYFGVSIVVIVIGTGIGILLKKISSKLFFLLTGGR